MQDTQMLRLEIDRTLNILPLESLKMAAKYIASLYMGVNSKGIQPNQVYSNSQAAAMDWETWFAQSDQLTEKVLARRNGKFIDADSIWDSVEADWEEHDNKFFSA